MALNLKIASAPGGTKNRAFNPVIVSTETNIFGVDRSAPGNYLVPGNGNPAVSTSGYYNMFGLYNFRPYDLLQWGSVGATAMANNGGNRYVWCCSADHPSLNACCWRGGDGFMIGWSNQPSVFPSNLIPIPRLQLNGSYFGIGSPSPSGLSVSGGFQTYEYPLLIYNPDDVDGLPIYLVAECGPIHNTMLWRSNDFINFTVYDLSHYRNHEWSTFVKYVKRTGVNQFTTIAQGTDNASFTTWTTTDGLHYTNNDIPIVGLQNVPDANGSEYKLSGYFEIGSQLYGVGVESATGGGSNQSFTIWPMDGVTFDKLSSPAKIRIQANVGANTNFPGPAYFQEVYTHYEDGILVATPTYGFCSDQNTSAQSRTGAPYSGGGGLDHQFMDRLIIRCDDVAARLSAPVQVKASCASGTVTLSWVNALPQNTYRVYRGTSASTQATLVGDVTGASTTDSPSTGRYWYKVVTLDNGTERGSRVVSVYVSSSNAFVNEHANRVLDDGCDAATLNFPFMDRADSMLTTTGFKSSLELFTHPACGVKKSSSVISKVYDLGTTRLPRSADFKAFTSNTTYSATSVNGGPGWTNTANNAYGYWGDRLRGNTIQQKRQITIIVAYERTTTASDFTFVGTGPIWDTAYDGAKILKLAHTSGSPGTIEFSLSDETSTKTASVTASGSGMQIAAGTFDGTDMYAYTGTTQSSATSGLDPNPDFGRTSGTPGYIQGALCGARNYRNSGTQGDVVNRSGLGFYEINPILGSGSIHCHSWVGIDPNQQTTVFNETHAQGKIQCVMVFEKALTSGEIATIVSFLQSTANW